MAKTTLEPQQEDTGLGEETSEQTGADELENQFNMPSVERPDPVSSGDLQQHFNLPSAAKPVYDSAGNVPSTTTGRPKGQPGGTPSQDDLANAEKAGGGKPAGPDDGESDESTKLRGSQPNTLGRGYRADGPAGLGHKLKSISRRKKIAAGFGITGVIIGLVVGFLSFLPFELTHIKNVATSKIGGVEGHTYLVGRKKLYSTMFFFDQNKNFSGFKVGGVRRLMLENRKTNKMTQALASSGYKITFDQITGKVQSLVKIDSDGKVLDEYKSNSRLRSAWSIRSSGDLDSILRQVFPDKSDFWYNRSTKQLYRRWGLTRTNWLKDKIYNVTGLTKVSEIELQFKQALRNKLFGNQGDYPVTAIDPTVKDKKNPTPTETNTIDNNKLATDVKADAQSLRNKMLADPSYNGEGSILDSISSNTDLEKLATGATGDALRKSLSIQTLNVLNATQNACLATSALNNVVSGARTLRAAQLMKFSLAILTQADVVQNGKSNTAQQLNALMNYINSKDSNGNSFFNSSGWKLWTTNNGSQAGLFNGADKNQRDKYTVGGGYTGTLGGVNTIISRNGGGAGCSVANNPFVSFLGLTVGIGLGIITGGGFSLVDAGVNIGVSFATSFAVAVATQLLTPMVAGTIINGSEQGASIGNAFVSGAETLAAANGASTGMRPLSKKEFVAAQTTIQQDNKAELARHSIAYRLFSPNADSSLTNSLATSLYGFKPSGIASALLPRASSFGSLFGSKTYAADSADLCPDKDIHDNNLASTPFCNLIFGIPDAVFDQPDLAPDTIDDTINLPANTNGTDNVDDYGNPVAESKYATYLKQCTSYYDGTPYYNDSKGGIDVIHNDQGDYTDVCSNDLFNVYYLYMTTGQGENDALTGNLLSPQPSTNPVVAAGQTVTATPGTTQDIAKLILANNNVNLGGGRDVKQDIQAAADNKPGSAGAMTSLAILQLVQAIAQNHSVVISAIQSGGTGHCNNTPKASCPTDSHYNGDGIDFSMVDGAPLSGRDDRSLVIANIAMKILPPGSAFGQSNCPGAKLTLSAGFTEFSDTCNHLHVQVPAGTP